MCIVSNMYSYWEYKWPPTPYTIPASPLPQSWPQPAPYNGPTREQFEEFLKLLRAGIQFDNATGQPDCEMVAKREMLKKMLDAAGYSDLKIPGEEKE